MKRTKRQDDAFTQRPGEDAYAYIARTIRTLRPAPDLVQLYMIRSDDSQREAIRLWADLQDGVLDAGPRLRHGHPRRLHDHRCAHRSLVAGG